MSALRRSTSCELRMAFFDQGVHSGDQNVIKVYVVLKTQSEALCVRKRVFCSKCSRLHLPTTLALFMHRRGGLASVVGKCSRLLLLKNTPVSGHSGYLRVYRPTCFQQSTNQTLGVVRYVINKLCTPVFSLIVANKTSTCQKHK